MGLVKHSALSNLVKANAQTLWKIPQNWTLEDAATVPLVYSTVLYALIMVSAIRNYYLRQNLLHSSFWFTKKKIPNFLLGW